MGILLFSKDLQKIESSYSLEVYLYSQSSAIFDLSLRFLIFSNSTAKHYQHWTSILAHIIAALRQTLVQIQEKTEKRFTISDLTEYPWFSWKPARLLAEIVLLADSLPSNLQHTSPELLSNLVIGFMTRNLLAIHRAVVDLTGDILDTHLPENDIAFLYLEMLQCLLLVDEVYLSADFIRQTDFSAFHAALQKSLAYTENTQTVKKV